MSIYSANLAIVQLSDTWRPLLVALAAAVVLTAVLGALLFNLQRGAAAAAVVIGGLYVYHGWAYLYGDAVLPTALEVWIALVIVIGLLAAWKAKFLTYPLNFISILLVFVAVASIVQGRVRIAFDEARIQHQEHLGAVAALHPPDIYYIIMDGYGRTDTLKRVLHVDNSGFIDALRKRGFYVVEDSHSNYVQTEISLSSSLNMQLIPTLLPKQPRDTTDREVFDELITRNELASFLKGQGYETISITTGFPAVRFPLSDVWMDRISQYTLFETTLLQMTPFVDSEGSVGSQFDWRRRTIDAAFKDLKETAGPTSRPRFIFVHILAPHPPFVFGPNGEAVRHHGPFGYWDASDFMGCCGNWSTYRDGEDGQIAYLNTQLISTVDAIQSAETTKPVIVIQGDHGSKSRLDQNDLSKTDVTEAFPNLEALYLPDAIRAKLYPTITPVNEFRLILAGLFALNMPLLPDRSWYSPFGHPLEFTDVTSTVAKFDPDQPKRLTKARQVTSGHGSGQQG